ncbi:hypothetical protein P691DRAFT_673016 [Macrolepiota fuliginosa MF-IS2]|uniref:Uncharacterized protein n=1 Tax=Macrolepiota fuliginosa MF-IS2 TaxID=1400762 RepID=A0A9P5X8Z3_9AGAR|nr:hypothetical protein P691DRAFT_673016 [Macrolepiota fuliginosa MF-IS2]
MTAVLLPHPHRNMHPRPQKCRRNATSVLSGYFDPIPQRDVLTSLLNGVGPNKEVEGDGEVRKIKKKETKKDKRRDSSARRDSLLELPPDAIQLASSSTNPPPPAAQPPAKKKKSFWAARPERPNIQIMTMERSVSVTPPPGYSPVTHSASPTPGPSMSISTSRTSSKRPRTPDDEDEDIVGIEPHESTPPPPPEPKLRKKRIAHKKGWKGWIEGSPPPSNKLINLDSAPVLQDRRLRSGKNFDAISVGKEGWV